MGYIKEIKIGNGTANLIEPILYGTTNTAAGTQAKVVNISNFELVTGVTIAVKFTVTNTHATPQLNVNSTGAKLIKYRGGNLPSAATLTANRVYQFVYDGTNWELIGDLDTNTQTITGVKGNSESSYRTGQVNLTAANVGAVAINGDTMTGNLIAPSIKIANTYYGITFGKTNATSVETILHTGIKWVSGKHMPVIHITGYAYGLSSPVEFKIGFYIYADKIGWCGITNMGAWQPNVFLFKDTHDDHDYVGVGLAGSCYFLQLQADLQDEMGKFGSTDTDSSKWSWTFSTTTGVIPAADDGTTCVQVPYRANILNPSKVNGHTVEANVPSNAKFTDTTALTSMTGTLAIEHGGTNATSAEGARTNLGLGSIATETATNYLKWHTTSEESTELYDFGAYVNQGNAAQSGPTNNRYFALINIPYRKASGNTTPDYSWQIGGNTDNNSRLWFRTATSNAFGNWQEIAHATTGTQVGNATTPVYMSNTGVITAGTAYSDATVKYANMLTGLSSRSTTMAWGNQTGTVITCMSSSGGGGWGFRDNNPASGQMSMTIDGTVYIKEGAVDVGDAVKSFSVSGKTVTYTTLWGNTGTFTTQDTDTLVKQTRVANDIKYKLLTTTSASPTTGSAAEAYYSDYITANPSTGSVSAERHTLNLNGTDKAYMIWDDTDQSIDFIFE